MSMSSNNWPTGSGPPWRSIFLRVLLTMLLFSVFGSYLQAFFSNLPGAWQACSSVFGAERTASFLFAVVETAHSNLKPQTGEFLYSPFQHAAGAVCCWVLYKRISYWVIWPALAWLAAFVVMALLYLSALEITVEDVTSSWLYVIVGICVSFICTTIARYIWW